MRKWILPILGLGFLLFLGGCDLPVPTCSSADMVAPVLQYPANWSLVDPPPPTLSWQNPGSCNPERYQIRLSTGPFFTDALGGGVSGSTTSWTPTVPLEPATEYAWAVNPVVGSTLGPSAGFFYFFTGPMCHPSVFVAPTLLEPANNAVIMDNNPTLIWDYPDDCLPAGYVVHLSTDPTFADTSLHGGTGRPSTRWMAGSPLRDCTRYYWRIAPITGTTVGPFSETFTFRVEISACPAEEETMNMIRGKVFHDTCSVPDAGPLPDPLPLGCRADAAIGDGVWQPFDPGIEGVVVRLGSGACPAVDRGAVVTDANGDFFFFAEPGHYCVSVDSLDVRNDEILVPGSWTSPADSAGAQVASWEVDVSAGETVYGVYFGWDYQFLPPWNYGSISGVVWHDLCAHNPADPAPPVLPSGCVVNPWGVVRADGVRQDGEPGIPGVSVSLGYGPCPSSGLAEAITDADGVYTFPPLPPGDYCISVGVGEWGSNHDILMPGDWTMVPGGHEGWSFRAITLVAGDHLTGLDFGWDYDNLPRSLPPYFKLNTDAFCRLGPDKVFDPITALRKDWMAWIESMNLDRSWFYVRLPGGKGFAELDPLQATPTPAANDIFCWIAASTGSVLGDLNQVPVRASPPTPTPAPDSSGPTFSDLTASPNPVYYPSQCKATTLRVSVKIEDPSGVSGATLFYRYVTSTYTGSWHSRPMSLSGGAYLATVEVGSEAGGEIKKPANGRVEYYVVAVDGKGNQSRTQTRSVVLQYCLNLK